MSCRLEPGGIDLIVRYVANAEAVGSAALGPSGSAVTCFFYASDATSWDFKSLQMSRAKTNADGGQPGPRRYTDGEAGRAGRSLLLPPPVSRARMSNEVRSARTSVEADDLARDHC